MISYCHAYPTAVVAHPWNCAQFFNCSHRQSRLGGYLDECPYPMLYSTEKQICSNFTAVNCKSRPEPKGPCKIKINMDPFSYICNAFDIKSVLYFFLEQVNTDKICAATRIRTVFHAQHGFQVVWGYLMVWILWLALNGQINTSCVTGTEPLKSTHVSRVCSIQWKGYVMITYDRVRFFLSNVFI